jgi:hypothetical protein
MNEKEILAELEKEKPVSNTGNNFFLGFTLGLITPLVALIIFNASITHNDSISSFINNLLSKNIFAAVISITGIPNLALFFLFLKLEKYKTVKGIMTITAILAILVFIIKFFVQEPIN